MGISSHPELLEKSYQLIPIFKCLGDEMRSRILIMLSDQGELNVNQITEQMSLSRPAVSHHLTQLKNAGLVSFRKEATERHYHVTFVDTLGSLEAWINMFRTQCKNLK